MGGIGAMLAGPVELELIEGSEGRIVERERVRALRVGDRLAIDAEPLVVHQGCGRAAPPGVRDAARRLELDDATVTWGVGAGHCQVWAELGVVCVRDSGSDNGTFIEREGAVTRVTGGQVAELREGDVLRVGRVALRALAGASESGKASR
jgi:hypothetical protein